MQLAAVKYAEVATHEVACEWGSIRKQILSQWDRVTPNELEDTHHDRRRIARLIGAKYGVQSILIENYLRNLERTLPLMQ